mgnify:CR=1 FL=1
MVDVRGKWALITGASRGIGRLIALFLAERGCNLVLHGRSAAHLEGVLAEVKALGVEAYGVGAELADPDQVTELLRQVDALQVQIDFVFNNAGVQAAYRTDYFTTPVSDFTQSFQINTIAPAMICYHFLPGMMERGFGRILNTTSVISVLRGCLLSGLLILVLPLLWEGSALWFAMPVTEAVTALVVVWAMKKSLGRMQHDFH